jgi:hypothetical protein
MVSNLWIFETILPKQVELKESLSLKDSRVF